MWSCAGQRGEVHITEVVCDRASIMSDDESLSPGVRVFMMEKKALWHEFEHGFSQQGSSSEGNPWADVPSARALSQAGAGPSGRGIDEVNFDDIEAVDSEETPDIAETEMLEAESDVRSHQGRACY